MLQFWRQLRWQIIGAQMLVVIVGVVTLNLTANALLEQTVPPEQFTTVHTAVIQALTIAAIAATIAGLTTSILLVQVILRSLRSIAHSSQRIAAGRYDERVNVPASDELRAVAESFNQMAEALEQIEQRRVTMIGNVAHELRTPLAGIEGYLEGLIDGVLPAEADTFLEMKHEVRRLHRLVDDLQTLSRVEAGQISLHFTTFDINEVIRHVVSQLQPQVLDGCLKIICERTDQPILTRADPDRVAQILLNLLGNAVRYTPEGGCITVRSDLVNEWVKVTVEDTGIGIAPEHLPYIFERFYRADPSRSRASGGSGIGLTIARHLAWAMGGDITAYSAGLGKGSRFTLTLPHSATHP
ncbi:sensor histidine kinase [Chloroflexus aggregans]|uniref:histidine kinase n=1 Tax=Chloroflexus aggregans (strain MD-66 / DSM 9485) TaxID=326427 RepID=B8G7R2_CHLAD|nr:HAMP domain-containing sensor histidine kinase [Chloroflexus aggregans]ACL24091.1 histidine kinase [Chloroflexus aggregans DSM 9485]